MKILAPAQLLFVLITSLGIQMLWTRDCEIALKAARNDKKKMQEVNDGEISSFSIFSFFSSLQCSRIEASPKQDVSLCSFLRFLGF